MMAKGRGANLLVGSNCLEAQNSAPHHVFMTKSHDPSRLSTRARLFFVSDAVLVDPRALLAVDCRVERSFHGLRFCVDIIADSVVQLMVILLSGVRYLAEPLRS